MFFLLAVLGLMYPLGTAEATKKNISGFLVTLEAGIEYLDRVSGLRSEKTWDVFEQEEQPIPLLLSLSSYQQKA